MAGLLLLLRTAGFQLLAVGEFDIPRIHALRTILCRRTGDLDPRAGRQGIAGPAQAEHDVGRSAFNAPSLGLAVRHFRIDIEPGVRIYEVHLEYFALDRNALVAVELRGKRMVRG